MKLRQVVHVAWTLPYKSYIGMPFFSLHCCYATVQKGSFPFSFLSGFSLNAGFWHSVCKGDHEKFNFSEINNSDIIINSLAKAVLSVFLRTCSCCFFMLKFWHWVIHLIWFYQLS